MPQAGDNQAGRDSYTRIEEINWSLSTKPGSSLQRGEKRETEKKSSSSSMSIQIIQQLESIALLYTAEAPPIENVATENDTLLWFVMWLVFFSFYKWNWFEKSVGHTFYLFIFTAARMVSRKSVNNIRSSVIDHLVTWRLLLLVITNGEVVVF